MANPHLGGGRRGRSYGLPFISVTRKVKENTKKAPQHSVNTGFTLLIYREVLKIGMSLKVKFKKKEKCQKVEGKNPKVGQTPKK